jgi:membrane protein implicated in regulation of membrane protease activity
MMNAVIIWFVIGAVLMVTELFAPGFVLVFFGAGAWAAALVAALWPGLTRELFTLLAVSLLSLFFLRHRLVTTFQGRKSEARQGAPEFIHTGRQAQVTQAIPAGGEGEISLAGSFWRATSGTALEQGRQARVLGHAPDNEILIVVEPWPTPPDSPPA